MEIEKTLTFSNYKVSEWDLNLDGIRCKLALQINLPQNIPSILLI